MADSTSLTFKLFGHDVSASKALKGVGDAAGTAGRKVKDTGSGMGSTFAGLGKGVAVLGAAGAALGAMNIVGDAFSGAMDAERQMKLLNSQVHNLGAAGKAAFADASEFADSFGASIGQDDDDIRAVMTKLASFPDAFKKGSLGAEAMHRGVKAAFDLQAIGIGSAESNIIGIGKALNDPVKGMTALSKSGVSFSAEQKKQIENYMKQGKLADAQRILLAGIESNAKGAAAAAASPVDKLKVAMANLGEGLAGKVLPFVEKLATYTLDKVLPWLTQASEKIGPIFKGIYDTIKGLFGGGSGGGPLSGFGKSIQDLQAKAGPAFAEIKRTLTEDVVPALKAFGKAMAPIVTFLINTLGPVVVSTFSMLTSVIRGALKIISGVLNVFAGLLTGDWKRLWKGVKQIGEGLWIAIKGIFTHLWTWLRTLFTIGTAFIKTAWSRGIAQIKSIATGAWSAIKRGAGEMKDAVVRHINGIVNAVRNLPGKIAGAAGRAWQSLTSGFKGAINAIIRGWNNLSFHLPGFSVPGLGSFGGMTVSTPNVPYLAAGGVATRPTLAVIGDGGEPEAVVPLSKAGRMGFGGGGTTVKVYVTQPLGTPEAIAKAVSDAFNRTHGRGLNFSL